jgi:8-amino-7-oxononanoate synthase
LQQETWRREKLNSLIAYFRDGAEALGVDLMPSATPIQPILFHDDALVVKVGNRLKDKGFLVGIIRPPTVPVNSARLRITLSSQHTEDEIDALLDALDGILIDLRTIVK